MMQRLAVNAIVCVGGFSLPASIVAFGNGKSAVASALYGFATLFPAIIYFSVIKKQNLKWKVDVIGLLIYTLYPNGSSWSLLIMANGENGNKRWA
jgi:hypothetical protein